MLQRFEWDAENVMNDVMPLVYGELKKLARPHLRREGSGGTLEATVLVHEAFLRLAKARHPIYESRTHFYGITSRIMRQFLVDVARSKAAEKRGGAKEVSLSNLGDREYQSSQSFLTLEDALQDLEKIDPLKGQLIEMRYFGGMTAEESSLALSKPVHLVRRELRLAEAWLRRQMVS
jgi:RNA polymerase sigma-70 factor, ECF subfamily